MSRRYGRNQKRRAREAIASLAAANIEAKHDARLQRGLLTKFHGELSQAREEIRRAKAMLPLGSILGEPSTLIDSRPPTTDVRVEVLPFGGMNIGDDAMSYRFESIPLDVLLTDSVLDEMNDRVHFDVRFAGNRSGYAISRSALQAMGGYDLIRMLAKNLAAHILADLKRIGVVR